MESERLAAFKNVRSQTGCCGIWCGSCAVGNGSIAKLTRIYEDLLRSYGLEHWAPEDLDYEGLTRALGLVKGAASCSGCRKGGGRDDCELRTCCKNKALKDCLECAAGADCMHADLLENMRSGARDAGLSLKDAQGADEPQLETGEDELRSKWPSSVLFMEESIE